MWPAASVCPWRMTSPEAATLRWAVHLPSWQPEQREWQYLLSLVGKEEQKKVRCSSAIVHCTCRMHCHFPAAKKEQDADRLNSSASPTISGGR